MNIQTIKLIWGDRSLLKTPQIASQLISAVKLMSSSFVTPGKALLSGHSTLDIWLCLSLPGHNALAEGPSPMNFLLKVTKSCSSQYKLNKEKKVMNGWVQRGHFEVKLTLSTCWNQFYLMKITQETTWIKKQLHEIKPLHHTPGSTRSCRNKLWKIMQHLAFEYIKWLQLLSFWVYSGKDDRN